MKSLFKATVVATSLAMTLGMSQAYADTAPKKEEVKLNTDESPNDFGKNH
ncbi:hypothetical protein [Morganella morganii]